MAFKTYLDKATGYLDGRHFTLALIIVMFLIRLPSVDSSFQADDFQQRNLYVGSEQLLAAGIPFSEGDVSLKKFVINLFAFAPSPEVISDAKAYGLIPWWADDELKLHFFRPITAMTHWLDYWLWPDTPELMHLHNNLWFMLLLLMLAVTYREFASGYAVASLALIVYALDGSSILPISWIANRNIIIALVFALVALNSHHRWRDSGSTGAMILAFVATGLSLLSAEGGVAMMAFIISYEACLAKGSWVNRGLTLAPYVLIVVLWRVTYSKLGFGESGTGLYIDPGSETALFIKSVIMHLPILIAAQFTTVDGIDQLISPSVSVYATLGSLLLLILIGYLSLPLLRQSPKVRFWFLATCIAAVPVTAVCKTHGRLMMFIAVGGAVLVAEFILYAFYEYGLEQRNRLHRFFTKGLGVFLIFAQVLFSFFIVFMINFGQAKARYNHDFHIELFRMREALVPTLQIGIEESAGKHVILLTTPQPHSILFIPYILDYYDKKIPASIRLLAPAFNAVDVTRTGERSFTLSADTPFPFYPSAPVFNGDDFSKFYGFFSLATAVRGDTPFQEKTYHYEEMDITITKLIDGYPNEVSIELKSAPDDDSYRWLAWSFDEKKYLDFSLPEIGKTVSILGPVPHRQ